MSKEVFETRHQVTHEIGIKVEDSLETARREIAILEGRTAGLKDAVKVLEAVPSRLSKDVEEGKLDLELAAKVGEYVTLASKTLQQLVTNSVTQRGIAAGKVQGLEQTVKLLSNLLGKERERIEREEKRESGEEIPRPSRFTSIKEQRRAAAKEPVAEDPAAEIPPEPAVVPLPQEG